VGLPAPVTSAAAPVRSNGLSAVGVVIPSACHRMW
jgi:hypothetical protein